MKYYLEEITKKIIKEHDVISGLTIVLPSQRASIYFKSYLKKHINKTSWLPRIVTIDTFFKSNTTLKPVDGIELITNFYDVYVDAEKENSEPFDFFIKWASTLLADFNEIDYYLADPKTIFQDLKNIKSIDNWSFNSDELSDIQHNFSNFWDKLYGYYTILNQTLKKQNKAYSGAIYKQVSNAAFEIIDLYEEKSVYFIGFNALSNSEKLLIQTFVNSKKGQFLFDGDDFYINNHHHEAGYFIRNNINTGLIDSKKEFATHFKDVNKNINLIASQSNIIQAKVAGEILQKMSKEELSETALVLADENLLIPSLNSVPSSIEAYNISMGYSLANTPLFSLINTVFLIQESFKKYGKSIHYSSLFNLIDHYLLSINNNVIKNEIIKKNILFVSHKFIAGFKELNDILFLFKEWNSEAIFEDAKNCLYKLINYIKLNLSPYENALELEYLFATEQLINKIEKQLGNKNYIKDIKTLKNLFLQLFKAESVAFVGEPLDGLQIIGMLETRAIDFKNIILLSANEGVLPKAENKNSFIPYELKSLYKLPTYKEKEAIYSNHFYRFLQRSENVTLIYNNAISGVNSNEKSRYINQLEEELSSYNSKIEIHKKTAQIEVYTNKDTELVYFQNELITKKNDMVNESGFSPTSLRTFINCKQDFYYKYIIGLKNELEVEETIEANTLGSIIHKVLEDLYLPFVGEYLTVVFIDKMLVDFRKMLENEFSIQYSIDFKTGKNFLLFNAAKKTIQTFLNQEKKLVKNNQIKIISLEHKLETNLNLTINGKSKSIKIKGTIDRVDLFNNELRVIDYKTGKVNASDLKIVNIEDTIDKKSKEKAFQLMIYTLLTQKEFSQYGIIKPGIISFKSLSAGLIELQLKDSTPLDSIADFKIQIEILMNQIYDPKISYVHNEKSTYCKYCLV